jgi:hypothetical protein
MATKFKMYLISHSHTDIGYTDRQEKIERYHVDFIKQAIKIFQSIESGTHKEWEGFKWTCENYWQVENFMTHATEAEIAEFNRLVLAGKIDVSLNYLNMTELADDTVYRSKLAEGKSWAKEIGFSGRSAMTADVNGYSWGYASALVDNGIDYLFSCVHGHHGLAPLRRQQRPFKWQTPDGKELLVWNGGHYMLGNEFLLIPNTRFTYHLKDEFENDTTTDQFQITERRIFRYVASLKEYGYTYDYVPVMISGVVSDNAPANGALMDTINKWNTRHGDEIELEMITLTDFFALVEKETVPVYSGDWNDWWADGVGSTPAATKIYKEAQRKYHLAKKLDPDSTRGIASEVKTAEDNLIMYAEHTWGYSSSISEPWNTLVNDLEYRKTSYATIANVAASKNLDEILASYGQVSIYPNREKKYKVINPHDQSVTDMATVLIEEWEHVDGTYITEKNMSLITATDCGSGEIIPSQTVRTARAIEVKVWVTLNPKEEKTIKLSIGEVPEKLYDLSLSQGSEGIADIMPSSSKEITTVNRIENDYIKMSIDSTKGINELVFKKAKSAILHPKRVHSLFAGIYEYTPIRTNPVEERRVMGRNRKGKFAKRYTAELTDVQILSDGELFTSVLLNYQLQGTNIYAVYLKVYKVSSRIDATIRVHKTSEWAPENLYVALPFSLSNSELFVDKMGCLIRPGIDQIPETNMDFYLTQNGMIYQSKEERLLINCNDAPLVTFGDLSADEITLANDHTAWKNQEIAYSWIMNNYWETNFKADLGGFYEFNYSIQYSDDMQQDSQIQFMNLAQGIIGISI